MVLQGLAGPASAQEIRDDLHVTNGPVLAMVRYGNTLIIGGAFTRVAPSSGSGVPIDKSSALAKSGFPKVAGTVYAVAPDGSGGWFVGGDFRAVGGTPRANLAHVLGDNTLASWDPSPDGVVTKLALGSGVVYVGGSFGLIGGASRVALAALDATTGSATAWNPNPDVASISAIVLQDSTVYVAGEFSSVGGQSRAGLAALEATSGTARAWDPNPDGPVAALATNGSTVYVGGYFSNIGGGARSHLAALDAATGNVTAWQWQPTSADHVSALAASGSTVYVAGSFSYSAGGNGFQDLGAFDAVTGLPIATWSCGGSALAFALDDATLYVSGFVDPLSGPERTGVVAVDATTGVPSSWDPQPNGTVIAVAVDGSHAFIGGEFASLGGMARSSLAALDLTTGQPTSWNPAMTGHVLKMGLSGSTLYVGGRFDLPVPVPGDTVHFRRNLAAFDLSTGDVAPWDPNAGTSVHGLMEQRLAAMAVSGSVVYVGGRFNEIGGQTRNYLAAIDASTGAVTNWKPDPNDSVTTITVDGDVVYVGGCFSSVGGQPRGGLAALSATATDSTDGVTLPWDPQPLPSSIADPWPDPPYLPRFSRGPIRAIAASGGTVYLGGTFDRMNGGPPYTVRWSLAAVDAQTGIVTSWDAGLLVPAPGFSVYGVSTVAAGGGAVYASGAFQAISEPTRINLVALDPNVGNHLSWNPVIGNGVVSAFLIDGPVVYLGGAFNSIGNQPQSNVASVSAASITTSVDEPPVRGLALLGARPNPTASGVRVAFSLPDARPARLELVDVAGRRVASRDVGTLGVGNHTVSLAPGRALPPGLYWARLTHAGRSLVARVVVLR